MNNKGACSNEASNDVTNPSNQSSNNEDIYFRKENDVPTHSNKSMECHFSLIESPPGSSVSVSYLQSINKTKIVQALLIAAYLISWVANAELLQGIGNGTLCPSNVPYNKPAFITWLNYNVMMVGFIIVSAYICYKNRNSTVGGTAVDSDNSSNTTSDTLNGDGIESKNLSDYIFKEWPGNIGFSKAFLYSALITYLLIATHILYVIGLNRISVATLNATYQVQAGCTLLLSVWILGDAFGLSGWIGVVVSTFGICLIVLPPLLFSDKDLNSSENYVGNNADDKWKDTLVGILSTLASAALWGCYQVAMRVFSDCRHPPSPRELLHYRENHEYTNSNQDHHAMTPIQGIIDNLTSIAMFGTCNLCFGSIVLPILSYVGFETFELPPKNYAGIITINAIVEYAFNFFCVIALYFTSPFVTAVTAPLTIPISGVVDGWLYSDDDGGGDVQFTILAWVGAVFIVIGVAILEVRPSAANDWMDFFFTSCRRSYRICYGRRGNNQHTPEENGLV